MAAASTRATVSTLSALLSPPQDMSDEGWRAVCELYTSRGWGDAPPISGVQGVLTVRAPRGMLCIFNLHFTLYALYFTK